MKREIYNFIPKASMRMLWQTTRQQFSLVPLLILSNIFAIVILSVIGLYAKVERKGNGVEKLFSDPFDSSNFYLGWLTSLSEIFWCVAISICIFSIALLSHNHIAYKAASDRKHTQKFLLVSALLMSLLYIDDRFRLTLIICDFFNANLKPVTNIFYGSLLILYAKKWWWKIRTTTYFPLLICFCLFGLSSYADIVPLQSHGASAMLEDGTKLIGLINLTFYFWYVCSREIKNFYLNSDYDC
ncbi:MAG: hypothetical protein ACRC2R_10540 [Xenococcaceae cyanobacterium]